MIILPRFLDSALQLLVISVILSMTMLFATVIPVAGVSSYMGEGSIFADDGSSDGTTSAQALAMMQHVLVSPILYSLYFPMICGYEVYEMSNGRAMFQAWGFCYLFVSLPVMLFSGCFVYWDGTGLLGRGPVSDQCRMSGGLHSPCVSQCV